MKKALLILIIVVCVLNFLYTFGYQGPPMSQFEFLSRTLGSITIGILTFIYLQKQPK